MPQLSRQRDELESVVKTIIPLLAWTLHKAVGPDFTQDAWRAIALSLVPPDNMLRRVDK
ncbi:hypothetical protein ACFLXU_02890 [Chloroflexota bacterium]